MKTLYTFLVFWLLSAGGAFAQQITNVKAALGADNKTIVVTYDITAVKKGQKFDLTLWLSTDNGSYRQLYADELTGDFGTYTAGYDGTHSGRRITYDPLRRNERLQGSVKFEVRAAVTDPVTDNMVLIKGGTFQMGDDGTTHSVTVSDFYMGKYEVTLEEFMKFIDATGYQTDADKRTDGYGSWIYDGSNWNQKDGVNWKSGVGGEVRPQSEYTHPVLHVSRNDAVAYCTWMSKQSGKTYRLPTEAEWEYAAGGGASGRTQWAGTDTESALGSYAWYDANSGSKTHPVWQKSPNKLGLYDLSGNVWEWCSDWYGTYPAGSQTNPQGATTGAYRVARGGSWSGSPRSCRVAYRYGSYPADRGSNVGFRLVRSL